MAATAEIARPGVDVIQTARKTSPTFLTPTLAPVIVGAAFEVINVLTSDGTINSKAKYGAYAQLGKTITHSSFPNPRGNIDEVDIQTASIRPFLYTGGRLAELLMNPGEGFLVASHVASKAVLDIVGTSFSIGGQNLVLAIDQPTTANTTQDVTIPFPGSSPYAPADIVTVINNAFGMAIASVTVSGDSVTGVRLSSPSYGALSSITVRAGGTANALLGIGWNSVGSVGTEERVCGAGYRAYNLQNNTTQSAWIEFFRGDYSVGGVSSADSAWASHAGMINVATGALTHARSAAITFGTNGIPILAGDQIWADGTRLKSGEISRVDPTRFRMGTIDAALSTADTEGRYLSKTYDDALLGLPIDAAPFAPQYVWFKATGLSPTVSATKSTVTGSAAASAAVAASVEGGAVPDPSGGVALAGLRIDYILTVDGVATVGTFTFTSSTPVTTVAGMAAAVSITGVVASVDSGKLKLATAKTGRLQSITFKATSSAATVLGYSTSADTSGTGTDASFSGLTGENLRFSLDRGAHVYDVGFTDTSLDIAVDTVNQLVGGTVASKNGAGTNLVLTSTLAGAGSLVYIVDGTALTALGFTAAQTATAGTGRPNPDAYVDVSSNLVIGPDLVRDPVTGYPLDFATSPASLYIQFKGLRRDVSASAAVAGVVHLQDTSTLTSVMDPVTDANPLAFGTYLALLNCPGFVVGALGVDEISGSAPEGTELAYARAADFLESEEVYTIALLTQNDVVHQLFNTHVTLMSQPEEMGERIVLFNKTQPTTRAPRAVVSGVSANSTATADQLLVDVTPQAGLVDAGINPSLPFTVANGVYIEFNWNGVFYRYSISSVTGGLVNLRTTFAAGENDDYFYEVVALPTDILDAAWSMNVRGASLMIAGSSPAKPDYSLVASTVATLNSGIANRRAYSFFPDTVKTTVAGLEKEVPGYYACAVVAGMIAGLPPQQGLTNYPMTGLTGVVGTEKFTKKQLDQMAGGGAFILMQEVQGGPVFCRHQLSTDTSTIETRELSITKDVDFVAKFLRAGIRRFIGRQNITSVFLDTIGTTITGMLEFLKDNGILNGAQLNNIIQDPENPDTVMIDVTLDVPYPCNYIRLTLVV
jgi:hypothetical protein